MASTSEAPAIEPRYRNVIVPLDGSDFAAAAVRTAQALAERLAADLHSVSVAEEPDEVDALRRHAAEALGTVAEDERVRVVAGDEPAASIGKAAADLEPALVCLSTHGRGRFSGALIGSVARSILLQTREPVVALGPSADRPRDFSSTWPAPLSVARLVACIDGRSPSESLVPIAAAWARVLGMSLTILTVAEPVPRPIRADVSWNRRHGPEGDADEYARAMGATWTHVAPEVDSVVVYDPVSPASGVRAYLDEHPAGLIAVTTHARTGLRRALLGADAAAIVHASTAPALVVPLAGSR